MAVKLGELIKQVENTGIRLVGGKGGLSNPVEWFILWEIWKQPAF